MANHAPSPGALVGRDDELMVLRAALDAARAGRPTIALLTGEAGIGKTRLAHEAARMARADGMRVVRGEADASWREPMELWRGVYRALGIDGASDPSLPAEVGPMLSVRFHDPEGFEGEINCLDPNYDPSTVRDEDEIVDPNWFERTRRVLRARGEPDTSTP